MAERTLKFTVEVDADTSINEAVVKGMLEDVARRSKAISAVRAKRFRRGYMSAVDTPLPTSRRSIAARQ